jgi:RND family efflux transporter MFP subunit
MARAARPTPRLSAPLFALSLVAAFSLAGCGGHDDEAKQVAEPRVVDAQVTTIDLSTLASVHAAPASVVAETQVQVASRLMGHIREINVAEGQAVSPGQRLFSIDPVDIQGQVDQARAALQQAEDAQRDAKVEYDRFSALLKEEAVTRQQYEKMKLQHDLATARVNQAQSGLATASHQLRYATVTAPIAGVVTRKLANAGDLAAPGQPVLTLENPAKLQILTHVPEAVFRTLKVAAPINVEVDGQAAPIQARVAQLSPAADPVSRLFLVKLDTAAPGLRSGLFARALFPQGERQVLAVPASALVTRAGISGVFVAKPDGQVEFRMVQKGAVQDGRVEVQAGLNPGERVVTQGAERIENGDKIRG